MRRAKLAEASARRLRERETDASAIMGKLGSLRRSAARSGKGLRSRKKANDLMHVNALLATMFVFTKSRFDGIVRRLLLTLGAVHLLAATI